ncbi:MAG: hypothetical protein A2020_09825 [Lentisphaerae bacterium GWF2_45_14]|nr:MAG: hypothetical protein A2020_09825 [Lentisphaerae bacterium GWF2_45_14]
MKITDFSPPLSDRLLKEYNFFELYPFDGGGNFIHMEILGTVDDREIFEKIKNGALNDFGTLPEIASRRFEFWRTIEKSCWINRYYFIVPLAKRYWLTKDESIAVLVKDTMLNFIRGNKPPQGKEEIGNHIRRVYENRDSNYNSKTIEEYSLDEHDVEYIWFDFQPASRVIHFLYSMYFLKDSPSVSSAEWEEMENSIKDHALLIMTGEKHFNKLKISDNHQSVRSLALLFAAAFFNGADIASEFLSEGIRIASFHILNDYFNDGVLKEVSPSYHFFETWHMRDAYLLSRQYAFALPEEASAILKNAGLFSSAIAQPDSTSAVINDGYALKLEGFLASLPDDCRVSGEDSGHSYFPDAGLAVFRDAGTYLLFDFSCFTGQFSHYHGGKNSFTYWAGNKPFFIDSGCCNYDNPLFAKWFKTPAAHSSLLIDGCGDAALEGTYKWLYFPDLCHTPWTKEADDSQIISVSLKSPVPEWKDIEWERKIKVSGDRHVSISDRIIAAGSKKLTFNFVLHPDVSYDIRDGEVFLSNGETELTMSFCSWSEAVIDRLPCKAYIGGELKNTFRITVSLMAVGGENIFCTIIKVK